jgi:hypothetical protein
MDVFITWQCNMTIAIFCTSRAAMCGTGLIFGYAHTSRVVTSNGIFRYVTASRPASEPSKQNLLLLPRGQVEQVHDLGDASARDYAGAIEEAIKACCVGYSRLRML